MTHPVDAARRARARAGEPHRPRPNMARTACLDCGRPIAKVATHDPWRHSYWRHAPGKVAQPAPTVGTMDGDQVRPCGPVGPCGCSLADPDPDCECQCHPWYVAPHHPKESLRVRPE